MKRIFQFLVVLILTSCKKDSLPFVYGEVIDKGGCYTDNWLVKINNLDPGNFSFLCPIDQGFPVGGAAYSCANSVFIKLPAHLALSGKKIKFSRWQELPNCLSLSYAPSHLEVRDVSEQ